MPNRPRPERFVDVLRRRSRQRELEIVDDHGAVDGQRRDEAALHQIDARPAPRPVLRTCAPSPQRMPRRASNAAAIGRDHGLEIGGRRGIAAGDRASAPHAAAGHRTAWRNPRRSTCSAATPADSVRTSGRIELARRETTSSLSALLAPRSESRYGPPASTADPRHPATPVVQSPFPAGVAQLVRARGSYPRCPGFKSLHRHQFLRSAKGEGRREKLVSLLPSPFAVMSVPPGPSAPSGSTACSRRARVCSWRCRADPTPWRCSTCCRRSSGAVTSSSPARRISIISCAAPRRTPTSSSAGSWRPRSSLPIVVGRGDVRALARGERALDRGRGARRAVRVSERRGRLARRRGHRRRPQSRGSGGDLPAAADSRCGAGAGSPGSGRAPACVIRPLLEIPRAELRAYAGEHGLRFREDSSNADVAHSAQPRAPRAAAAPGAVLAGDCRHPGARGGARPGGRRISGGRCNRIGRFDRLTGRQRRRARRRGAGGSSPRSGLPCGADSFAGSCARPLHRFSARRRFAGAHPTGGRVGGRIAGTGGERGGDAGSCSAAPSAAPFANSFSVPLSIPGEVEAAGWSVSAELPGRAGPSSPWWRGAMRWWWRPTRCAIRWRCGAGGRAIGSSRSVWAGGAGSCKTSWSTEKSPEPTATPCRSSLTGTIGSSGSSASRWPRIFASQPPRRA